MAMSKKVIILSLVFALLFLSACAGNEHTPGSETAPQPSDATKAQDIPEEERPDRAHDNTPWDLVGSVSIISDGVEHKPYMQFEHAGVTSSEGQMSGSPPAPPSIEELLEMLPKIKYSDDFKVIIDGEYANRVTYSLYEIEDFKRIFSEGLLRVESEDFRIPDEDGTYILIVSVIWSDSDSQKNYTHYSYISMIYVDSVSTILDDISDLVYAELIVENLRLGDEDISRSFGIEDADSLLWIENTFGSATVLGSTGDDVRPNCPFWATLLLTRSDGTVLEIHPATDDCTMFVFNDYYFSWGSGPNSAFYELFGASGFDSLLTMD